MRFVVTLEATFSIFLFVVLSPASDCTTVEFAFPLIFLHRRTNANWINVPTTNIKEVMI